MMWLPTQRLEEDDEMACEETRNQGGLTLDVEGRSADKAYLPSLDRRIPRWWYGFKLVRKRLVVGLAMSLYME